jgi:ribosomal protein S18 acetylase RimI-like enzyme
MIVTLHVPDSIDYQLVYRLERDRPFEPTLEPTFSFTILDSLAGALRRRGVLLQSLGAKDSLVAVAKLASKVRRFYSVLDGDRPVSYGWGTEGRCRHYKIERDAVVIGPIWTDPQVRGKGLATIALQAAIDDYIRRGRRRFYIDTSKSNLAAQRVFQKSGFGEPVALYFR